MSYFLTWKLTIMIFIPSTYRMSSRMKVLWMWFVFYQVLYRWKVWSFSYIRNRQALISQVECTWRVREREREKGINIYSQLPLILNMLSHLISTTALWGCSYQIHDIEDHRTCIFQSQDLNPGISENSFVHPSSSLTCGYSFPLPWILPCRMS
jgi:hypothetical protein